MLIKRPEKVEDERMKITESCLQDVFRLYGQGFGKAIEASDLRKVIFLTNALTDMLMIFLTDAFVLEAILSNVFL